MLNGCYLRDGAEFYIAINNKGLWPNLTMLPSGEIGAVVYNKPRHGRGEGDVELWVSGDGGTLWELRSVVSDHSEDPEAMRLNHAVGLNANGDLVVLVAGFEARIPDGGGGGFVWAKLPVQVCISSDDGETWQRQLTDIRRSPFGDIVCTPDGTLVSAIHGSYGVMLFASEDNGQTWNEWQQLPGDHCEVALLRCSSGRWLAAMRPGPLPGMQLTTSEDEGETWSPPRTISLPSQLPGHLLELHDGRILLTCGNRGSGQWGVMVKLSDDYGESWSSMPEPLISVSKQADCGYPSSVQLEDGMIVSAYYMGNKGTDYHDVPWHHHYHMGVVRWHIGLIFD